MELTGERSIADLTYEEVMERFERYGFVDALGHQLTLCLDFQELVKAALLLGKAKVSF